MERYHRCHPFPGESAYRGVQPESSPPSNAPLCPRQINSSLWKPDRQAGRPGGLGGCGNGPREGMSTILSLTWWLVAGPPFFNLHRYGAPASTGGVMGRRRGQGERGRDQFSRVGPQRTPLWCSLNPQPYRDFQSGSLGLRASGPVAHVHAVWVQRSCPTA